MVNTLIPIRLSSPELPCPLVTDAELLRERYADFLGDESQLRADHIASLAFPNDIEQLAAVMTWHHEQGHAVTVSGSRTGVVGGAVPRSGDHVVSLQQLVGTRLLEDHAVVVGPGVTLDDLYSTLVQREPGHFFPVDPTERSASLGGMLATNAAGPRSLRYGATRAWVRALQVVLADGRLLRLRRGQQQIDRSGRLAVAAAEATEVLQETAIPKPATKHSLGYCYGPRQDVVDIFVGSEGTLGVIAEVELGLTPTPAHRLYGLQLFGAPAAPFDFVAQLRETPRLRVAAIEYLDQAALRFAASSPSLAKLAGHLPLARAAAAVFYEVESTSEAALDAASFQLAGLVHACGGTSEQSLVGTDDNTLRQIQRLRHAAPEQINRQIAARRRIHPGLHKIATDMAVPFEHLPVMVEHYQRVLSEAGLQAAMFGHVGDGHLHVNILPTDPEDLQRAKTCYRQLARDVVARSGAVAAEHGIGRLKKAFLDIQYGAQQLEKMARIKRLFDPDGCLAPGSVLDPGETPGPPRRK